MMVLPGGMERTEEQYRQLYQAAGFRLLLTLVLWIVRLFRG